MIPNQSIDHIYKQLTSKISEIENICDNFSESIEKIQTENTIFAHNKSFNKRIKSIKNRYKLLSNFCCLWNNPSDKQSHISIKNAIDSAYSLYIDRKNNNKDEYGFRNIIKRYKLNDILLSDIKNEDERKKNKELINSFFLNIKNNKLALIPYILIDNATKYARRDSDICITYNYINDEIGVITIDNIGPCIEETEKCFIFEQNFRGKNAKELKPHQGQGKGLYFARSIINELGCQIECKCDKKRESFNSIQYNQISFEITLYPKRVNDTNIIMDSTYYQFIDDMFSHEYFNNITDYIENGPYRELDESLNKHYDNLGLTEIEAEQLKVKMQELNITKKGVFLILNTYAYRNNLHIADNRSNGVIWSELYRDAQKFYKQDLENANIDIDFAIIVQHIFSRRYANYDDTRKIYNFWCIDYIPLLVYNFIVSIAKGTNDNHSNVIISLTPDNRGGYYIWHNTIEIELNNPQDIINYINSDKEPSNQSELSIKMLKEYLQKVQNTQGNGRLNLKATSNNNISLRLEFPISSENKY